MNGRTVPYGFNVSHAGAHGLIAFAADVSIGVDVEAQYLSMLPYLATIAVLVIISRDRLKVKLNAPACLTQPFRAAT